MSFDPVDTSARLTAYHLVLRELLAACPQAEARLREHRSAFESEMLYMKVTDEWHEKFVAALDQLLPEPSEPAPG